MSAAWSPLQIELPITLEGSVVRLNLSVRIMPPSSGMSRKMISTISSAGCPMPCVLAETSTTSPAKAIAEQENGGESVVFATVETMSPPGHRQHAIHEHRSHPSQSRNWFHLDRPILAAYRRQYRKRSI